MGTPAVGALLAGPGLAWLAGVAVQLQQASLAPWGLVAAAGAGGLALLVAGVMAAGRAASAAKPFTGGRLALTTAALLAGAALAGFGATGFQATLKLHDALPQALEGQDVQVTGIVAGLPQAGSLGLRFGFEVERATWRGAPVVVPRRIALGWYAGFDDAATLTPLQRELKPGQRWRFTVRLRRPHGNVNPHAYDLELALFEQGIRATGTVRDAAGAAVPLGDPGRHPVDRLRQRVRDALLATVPDARSAGVLAALVTGDQAAIARDDWALFRDTGVAHLMSISGLHVTMFAWLAGLAVGAAWRRHPTLPLRLAAPTAARWGGLLAAASYAVFAGWGVPAQRTVGMLAVVTLLGASGRRWPWPLVLLAAAVAVTALDPWALLQPGFWLSFTAVGILLAAGGEGGWTVPEGASRTGVGNGRGNGGGQGDPVMPDGAALPQPDGAPPPPTTGWRGSATAGARRLAGAAHAGLRTQAIATVALTPLGVVFFQQASVVGFPANLIAIPLVTLLITPLALLGVLAPPLWTAAAWLVARLADGLAVLASWPGAVWTAAAAPVWAQALGLAGGLLAMLPLPRAVRLAAIALVLPVLWPQPSPPAEGDYEMLVADVGQGTTVLVRTRHHLLVVDAGPRYGPGSEAGSRVLLPLLRALGQTRIDLLLLSHRDTDHVGGAAALIGGLPVGGLLSSLEAGHPLLAAGVPHRRCEDGQRWTWDGVRFEVLHPAPADYATTAKANALSCVLRIDGRIAGRPLRTLLPGDVERAQEAALVARHGAALQSDWLVVPHHGSRTSSSETFLDAVRPGMAVVQAGHLNRFGHPSPEVTARLQGRGIAVFETADCGAWHGDRPWPSRTASPGKRDAGSACERDRQRRYWHHPGPEPARRDGDAVR